VAEVKHRPSLSFFDGINIYYADTLHDARRVFSNIVYINLCSVLTCQLIRCKNPLFDGWSKDDSLKLENLYNKFSPSETYNGEMMLSTYNTLAFFSFQLTEL